jgi:hypothetical protein
MVGCNWRCLVLINFVVFFMKRKREEACWGEP